MKEFLDLAKSRYSCRKFSDRPVPQELVDKVISAAIAAPTAVNTQPFRIWVMESQQAKESIHKVTSYTFGADHFLLLGARRDASWTRSFDQHNFAEVDAAIVATHMMLEISDLGLATTWVGYFDAPALKKLYPQMADYELIALFPFGYAAEDATPSPSHSKRQTPDTLTEVL